MKKLFICLLTIFLLMPACRSEAGVYRALSAGVANYDDGRVRVGGINSTKGVYDALSRCYGPGYSFLSSMIIDFTSDELFSAIASCFEEAAENDVSFLYINAHGGCEGGISWIETRDGSVITASELEKSLQGIPGKVILFLDACNSGGSIGNQTRFAGGFADVFGLNSFASDKYTVCVSCLFDENSYRVTASSASEESVSTVFSRAVCEGLGWDLIGDRSTALKADSDLDRQVTFYELVAYSRRRCMFYLSSSQNRQTINFFCADPSFVLADRKGL